MANVLCDVCGEQAATVFVTKIVNNETTRQRLCESCARHRATTEGWMQHLLQDSGHLDTAQTDDIMSFLEHTDAALEAFMDQDGSAEAEFELPSSTIFNFGGFPADEDLVDEMEEAEMEEDLRADDFDAVNEALEADQHQLFPHDHTLRPIPTVRCSKCSTTWDRLRQDGRVGCSHCYIVFEEQLRDVMNRVQRAAEHTGKHPRTAEKRRRRLEHLRARRDHRLEMLNRRLQEAVAAEKYEDAAKLRDKIKIVASTIVSGE
ncbi:MAG: UvrB/UvrC motif-containing protein [Abitibacteriaceae bacterium]|nr:UvrB/UvrC motif-containing protein [Abditibacteriaceae bacterium]